MKLMLLISLLFSAAGSYAHDYFFAFAELDYNSTEKCFEITLEGSAHDVEDVLNETGIPIKELEDHSTDQTMLAKIESFINTGFTLNSGNATANLKLIGMEVKTNGMVYFYLKSHPLDILDNKVTIRFDWLMDQLPQQQNKVTIRYNNQKHTAVFLPTKRSEIIEL